MSKRMHEHVEQFGDSVGVVERCINYGTQKAPDVEVRWIAAYRTTDCTFMYAAEDVEILEE